MGVETVTTVELGEMIESVFFGSIKGRQKLKESIAESLGVGVEDLQLKPDAEIKDSINELKEGMNKDNVPMKVRDVHFQICRVILEWKMVNKALVQPEQTNLSRKRVAKTEEKVKKKWSKYRFTEQI